MAKHIDHLVWAVQDLAGAKSDWESLGFQASPKGVHPFGTANHLLMGDLFFMELLGIDAAQKIIPTTAEVASFSGLNQAYLQRGEGVSMIVLSSENAQADFEKYRSLNLEAYPPIHFSRDVILPNGEKAKLAFSIAFVLHSELPRLSFFVCQHHYPEHFWKAKYQIHQNGFTGLHAIEIVLDRPEELLTFFSEVVDTSYVHDAGVYRFKTAKEEVLLMDANTFCQRNALSLQEVGVGVRLVHFKINSQTAMEAFFAKNDIEIDHQTKQSIVVKNLESGVWLKFTQNAST